MTELPRLSYAVRVSGTCDHSWPGTVHVERGGTLFKLASDFATCPECGANATTVLFWEEADEEGAVGLGEQSTLDQVRAAYPPFDEQAAAAEKSAAELAEEGER